MIDNNEALSFFERIKAFIPTNEDGEIDVDKFKEILFNGDKSDPIVQYLFSKIPEFFTRAGNLLEPFYRLCTTEDANDYDELLLKKISTGDLSDIKRIEFVFPYIKKLTVYLHDINYISADIMDYLWKSKKIIPESWNDEFTKYEKHYDSMLKNSGTIFYKKGDTNYTFVSFGYGDKFVKCISENPNDRELLTFCYKLKRCYELCYGRYSENVFSKFDSKKIDDLNECCNNEMIEIKKLEDEISALDDKLKQYGFVKLLFKSKRNEKKSILSKKAKKQEKLSLSKNILTDLEVQKEVEIAAKEFVENYRKQYVKCIIEVVIPKIKSKIEKECEYSEQEILNQLLDNIVNNFITSKKAQNTSVDPLKLISDQILNFKDVSFDEFISKFDNALMTMAGLPKAILDFENLECKDLYSTLNIFRRDLIKIPTDSDHGELSTEFRTTDIAHGAFEPFFSNVTLGKNVKKQMELLNKEFIELMKIDDVFEYIKKTGIIWYKFLLIHPYADGNGRTSRYLLNALLAHKNIIIPSLFNSKKEQTILNGKLDKYVIDLNNEQRDYDKLGEEFLKYICSIAINLPEPTKLQSNQEKENIADNPDNADIIDGLSR